MRSDAVALLAKSTICQVGCGEKAPAELHCEQESDPVFINDPWAMKNNASSSENVLRWRHLSKKKLKDERRTSAMLEVVILRLPAFSEEMSANLDKMIETNRHYINASF